MGRRTAAVSAALGAGISLLAAVLFLFDCGSRAPWALGHAVLICLFGAAGGGFIILAASLLLQARRDKAAAEREHFHFLSHFSNTVLFEYRFHPRILTFSDNLPHCLGLPLQLEGSDCPTRISRLVHPDDIPKLRALATLSPAPQGEMLQELRLLHDDGSYSWYGCRAAAVCDRRGKPTALLGQLENINARKRREASLIALSIRDDLTGLLNRSAVALQVEEWAHSPKAKEGGALFVLDLDNFKFINDSWGHTTGDRALLLTARILRETFRESDILGRIGGDEFLVFMPGVSSPELAARRAEDLCLALSQQSGYFDKVSPFTCSTGISLYPRDGDTYAALFEAADAAMYRAKRDGKSAYRLSSELSSTHV